MFQNFLDFLGGVFSARFTERSSRHVAARNRSAWRKRARFSREVLLPESHDAAETRVRRVLTSFGVLRDAPEFGALEAVTDSGARSNGTVVHVQLVATDEGTRVEVAAWPGAQLFDWGESRRVVEQVIAALGPSLPVDPPIAGRLR